MTRRFPLRLFAGYGIELEYMIVDRHSLSVKPVADRLLAAVGGVGASEVSVGAVGWSNELTLHVFELKTDGPVQSLSGLADLFLENVRRANQLLESEDAILMPTAMHPWMDPLEETRLWPHEQNDIYRAFDRIFSVSGHGWANVQSVHINLPFGNDSEFRRLHAAIRVVLPLIPALAAASPIVEGRVTGYLDTRLRYYRVNQRKIPEITGRVIPEAVHSIDEYQKKILAPMYRAIAPHDPDGILQEEWLNSRGAIARFDRGAIEFRLVDSQESAQADLAVSAAIVALTKALAEERWVKVSALDKIPVETLEALLLRTIRDGEEAVVEDEKLLAALGERDGKPIRAGKLWERMTRTLIPREVAAEEEWDEVLDVIHSEGTLARRILRAVGVNHTRASRTRVYGRLCQCLAEGEVFHAPRS